ncbi:MAG TPA: NAD-dependent dehydratase [Marinilabiliales bacterium]|nr:NAD-dependent dehydratase [Marinilabiliales bacterium]
MKKNNKVALVTGATGFVGSHLTRYLVNKGWAVHIIIRPQSKIETIYGLRRKITIHKYNGTTIEMVRILKLSQPQIVFHLASLFLAGHQSSDIISLIQSNILFGTQLAEAMVKNGVYKMVNTGTSWQHYNNEDYNPVNLYAATKQAFESILEFYLESTSLKIITLKLFDTYGPNDSRPKLFNLLKKSAKKSSLPMSDGKQLLDIVYIDDIINAYMIAAERLLSNKAGKHEHYAISSNHPISLRNVIAVYEKTTESKLPIKWGARSYRPREVMIPWNKGKKLPGWDPQIPLEKGIKRII